MSQRDIQELTEEIRELRIEAQGINRRLTIAEASLELLNRPIKETKFGFTVGDRVKIVTVSIHRSKEGTIIGFSPKKVRVKFQGRSQQTFFPTSLHKIKNGADEQHE